ncbi:MAG TPA: 4Fe-4S dicluster domain-containing protein, partial [Clostridia bacterium]|nr:4Fe-4S dicluster domain-containing protein [Clostridia bacterium]
MTVERASDPLVLAAAAREAAAVDGGTMLKSGPWFLLRANLQVLIDELRADGRTVIGPTVADGAIVYDEISGVADLPEGWGDRQEAGQYRLSRRRDRKLFQFNMGPSSWKRFTFPPVVPLSVGRREGRVVTFEPAQLDPPKLAFLGVRGCELAALGIQDRVFLGGPYTDEDYRGRRAAAFVVAVNCTTSAPTCFCTSMDTGPEIRGGHDLVLTELDEGFVVRAGSEAGANLLARLPVKAADAGQIFRAAEAVGKVAAMIGDPLPTAGLHDRLLAQFDSPRWAEIAERCLMCANCSMVCPTCFCSSVTQRSDLDGHVSTSERVWDFCFTASFARVAGGNFRNRPRDRYRQWLTHKFATWIDQFGTFGCVGCGRCIAWCPVGIDVREELMAIAPPLEARPKPVEPQPVAASPSEYATARIEAIRTETADVSTLILGNVDPAFLTGRPGQFAMIALPAYPPMPISISRYRPDGVELTIRAAGPATAMVISLGVGAELGLRGPLGTGWPLERAVGRDVVIVTGGIGLAPLRPLVDAIRAQRDRFGTVRLYYGA